MNSRFIAAVLAALVTSVALAQTERSGGAGGASAQIMQQYQQLSAERTVLKADNERLKKEADEAKAQLSSVRKERDALKTKMAGSTAAVEKARSGNAAAEQALVENRHKLEEVITRYKSMTNSLASVEFERSRLTQELRKTNQALDTCAVRNVTLYNLSTDVLSRWESEGVFTRLARAEPFTRIKKTELENLVDDYRARAADAQLRQVTPTGASPGTTEQPPGHQ